MLEHSGTVDHEGTSFMDKLSVAEMDRETITVIEEIVSRLTRKIESVIDPETRDRYEDAHAALVLVCREARD